jgi:hypothetical protein
VVIEPTDDMISAFDEAVDRELGYLHRPQAEVLRVGLAAVLAIVERDYDVTPKLPPVEHRLRGEIWWNFSAESYQADCACGEEFTGWPRSEAEHRLLDHIEAAP